MPDRRCPAVSCRPRPPRLLRSRAALAGALLLAGAPAGVQGEPADGIPTARSAPVAGGPMLVARIVDGAQDFDEWHELEIELSVVTDGSRHLVRRLRVLPSDEVEPDCADVRRMSQIVLPAQATTVLPPLELKVSERQREAWLRRLLQRQHRRYVVLALELERLDGATAAPAPAAVAGPAAAATAGPDAALPAARSTHSVPADACAGGPLPPEPAYDWLFATLPVLIDTPPWSMHAGAVLGALLSTLFAFVSVRSDEAPDAGGQARRPSLRVLPGELFMTALACLIAVMLLQSTSTSSAGEAGLPLQVAVKDFYGGLLIGLFGRQIVGFVRRRLNGDPDAPATPPPLAANAPAPPPATAGVPALTRLPGPSGTGPQPEQTGDRP